MAFEDKKDWYEPHPVSPARKKELSNAGFRIFDAQFAPANWEPDAEQLAKDKKAAAAANAAAAEAAKKQTGNKAE